MIRDEEFKHEVVELLKWVIQQETFKSEFQSTFKKVLDSPEMQAALSNTTAHCFHQLILDPKTEELIKVFVFYLLQQQGEDKGIKKIIDLIIDSMNNKLKVDNPKQSQFEIILRQNDDSQQKSPQK